MLKKFLLTSRLSREPREALGAQEAHEEPRHLCQDCMMPGLLTCQDAPQVVLEGGCHAGQAKRHANIAVRWTLTPSSTRRPEALLRCGLVEPWDVDADAQPDILAWMGGLCQVSGDGRAWPLHPAAPE